jgi:quercetin dioxygenase-like cupin family protein/DNA-binding XRE family transcriptional regulator
MCQLSVNAISMIERGEASPKVSTLQVLAQALHVRITEFFQSDAERTTVFVPADARPVTRAEGMQIEGAGTGLEGQQLEPFIVTVEPAPATHSPVTHPEPGESEPGIRHPGQEFVYCLEGRVVYEIEGRSYLLEPGDSLLFHATQLHSVRGADTGKPGRILLVLQSPEGTELARERHLNGRP